jgi:hypothetical protein
MQSRQGTALKPIAMHGSSAVAGRSLLLSCPLPELEQVCATGLSTREGPVYALHCCPFLLSQRQVLAAKGSLQGAPWELRA